MGELKTLSKQIQVKWEDDPALQRWLGTITRSSTKRCYKSAFKTYVLFTGLTASQLVDEALEDSPQKQRQRTP
jgi:hypothetical protein